MRRELTIRSEQFPLATPFRIARGVKTVAEVVTVELTQDGVTGRGEGVPYPRYGETVQDSIAAIARFGDALRHGAGREAVLEQMPAGAARNAVDCALWDLEMRLTGNRVAAALGFARPLSPLATAMTIGLDTPERMAAAARVLAGAPLLKVKLDREDPATRLRAVREAAPKPQLIVDPNESWTIAEVRGLQQLLFELRVDLLEQPLPAGADAALNDFVSVVPIAADESIHVATDLASLPAGYRVVNIKLDKAGGLTAALALAREARRRGLEVMTGCMICSSLSVAAALPVAVNSRFVDLDGPLWLAADRDGGVTGVEGMLHPPRSGFWGGA